MKDLNLILDRTDLIDEDIELDFYKIGLENFKSSIRDQWPKASHIIFVDKGQYRCLKNRYMDYYRSCNPTI